MCLCCNLAYFIWIDFLFVSAFIIFVIKLSHIVITEVLPTMVKYCRNLAAKQRYKFMSRAFDYRSVLLTCVLMPDFAMLINNNRSNNNNNNN